jgi:peptidyl-prolyl cis-trans isomerase SurA
MESDAATRAAAKKKTFGELVERMIDEEVERHEAERSHLGVTDDEVDSGIDQVARQAKMTKAELLAEAKKQGYSESDYRAEIRRQVLEGKLIQLRVRGRVLVTDADARAAYATWTKEQTGADAPVDVRIIVLRVPADATAASKKTTETLATQIISQARSGTDFCTLVTKHSQDSTTTSACGSRGKIPRSSLMPDIAKAASALKPGETASQPVFFTDPAGSSAYLVLQLAPGAAPAVPAFESVKEQMTQRAYVEATERERKKWLDELRKNVFIEVKL